MIYPCADIYIQGTFPGSTQPGEHILGCVFQSNLHEEMNHTPWQGFMASKQPWQGFLQETLAQGLSCVNLLCNTVHVDYRITDWYRSHP